MKKTFLLLLVFSFSFSIFAQETSNNENKFSKTKWTLVVTPKLGFAKIKESDEPTLNGFINGGDALISYQLTKKVNIQTGIGYFEFDANQSILGNSASLNNSYLQIPLNFNSEYLISKDNNGNNNFLFSIDLGLYANNLLKQRIETSSENFSDKNLGWNFGFNAGLGMKFVLSECVNIGIGYQSQSDISKAKKNDVERKIENLNTVYFRLEYKL